MSPVGDAASKLLRLVHSYGNMYAENATVLN